MVVKQERASWFSGNRSRVSYSSKPDYLKRKITDMHVSSLYRYTGINYGIPKYTSIPQYTAVYQYSSHSQLVATLWLPQPWSPLTVQIVCAAPHEALARCKTVVDGSRNVFAPKCILAPKFEAIWLVGPAWLGAIGLSSTSWYLARWREVLLTQFARSMATKVVVATTWLPVGIDPIFYTESYATCW